MGDWKYIRVRKLGDLAIVSFTDTKLVDPTRIEGLGAELSQLIDREGIKNLKVEFTGVEFLSSAALSQLILFHKKVKQVNGFLRLCGLRPQIGEVFSISRLDRVFDIHRSCSDDESPEDWGSWVPNPSPDGNLDGHAEG